MKKAADPMEGLCARKLLDALTRGAEALEECLAKADVEHTRIELPPPHELFGVRFVVGDQHWTAEFYENGKFKQLVWT